MCHTFQFVKGFNLKNFYNTLSQKLFKMVKIWNIIEVKLNDDVNDETE